MSNGVPRHGRAGDILATRECVDNDREHDIDRGLHGGLRHRRLTDNMVHDPNLRIAPSLQILFDAGVDTTVTAA